MPHVQSTAQQDRALYVEEERVNSASECREGKGQTREVNIVYE